MISGIRHLPVDVVTLSLLQPRTWNKTKISVQEGFLSLKLFGIIPSIWTDRVEARFLTQLCHFTYNQEPKTKPKSVCKEVFLVETIWV